MTAIWKYVRYIICLLLVFLIWQRIDYEQLRTLFNDIQYFYVIAIISMLVLQAIVKAYKWQILMKAKNLHIPALKIMQLDYVSSFLSLFFASGLSIDLCRGYGISKEMMTKEDAASSIIADRLISFFALLFLAVAGILTFHDLISNQRLLYVALILLAALTVMTGLFFNDSLSALLNRYNKQISRSKILKKLVSLREAMIYYKAYRLKLLCVFLLSLIIQLSRIFAYYLAALALQHPLPFTYFFVYIPLIIIIMMLPISFAGIGIREGSFIYFFTNLGVSHSTAFAIPFLVSIAILINLLPGAFMYAVKGLVVKIDPQTRDLLLRKK